MDDPFGTHAHAAQVQRRGVGRLQRQQRQVRAAGKSRDAMRQRDHRRRSIRRGNSGGHQEALGPQIGDPGHPAVQHPRAVRLARGDLQRLDAAQELHGVRQRGRTGLLTLQQRRQPGFRKSLVGAAQQILDEDSLAPGHEGPGNGKLANCAIISIASPISVSGKPPCPTGTPWRNTSAAASCGNTTAASMLPSSSASACCRSQACRSAGSAAWTVGRAMEVSCGSASDARALAARRNPA